MKSAYLKTGDMLFLPKGLMVGCHSVPRKVVNPQISPFDDELTDGRFKLGFEYQSRQDVFDVRFEIRSEVIKLFKQLKVPLNVSFLDRFLFSQIREQTAVKITLPYGNYQVTEVKVEKGTRWIYCEEMYSDPPAKIYFWQGDYQGRCDIVHNDIVPNVKIR